MLWMGRERAQIRHWREETKTGFSSARLVCKTEAEREGHDELDDEREKESKVFLVVGQREVKFQRMLILHVNGGRRSSGRRADRERLGGNLRPAVVAALTSPCGP